MTTAPTPALLPCPFCGGPASAHEVNPKEAPGWVHLTVAHTPDCFYRAPKETLLLSAADLERWNWQAELEARKPLPLSDEQIDAIADGMPGGLGGFMKTWGWRQFARKILDLRAPPIWEPQFDCMAPGQEELAVQFCAEIAGPRGQPGRNPDPVRLLEMAEALYKAEADAHGITASPAPLIASREVVADGPVRVTRLHLTAGGRAGLTSKAAGPLPGITGGSS